MATESESYSMTTLPLFQALTEHMLLANVPKEVLIVLGAISLAFLYFFAFFYIFFITGPLYLLAIYLTSEDAQFFDCYRAYVDKNNYYCT